jgi:hypothetical protein
MSWKIQLELPDCGPNGEFQKARVHVFPEDEEILHNIEGEFCFCSPGVEECRLAKIVVHASTDGREFLE